MISLLELHLIGQSSLTDLSQSRKRVFGRYECKGNKKGLLWQRPVKRETAGGNP